MLQANPLEGSSEIDGKSTGIDKYFLKVVRCELCLPEGVCVDRFSPPAGSGINPQACMGALVPPHICCTAAAGAHRLLHAVGPQDAHVPVSWLNLNSKHCTGAV